MTDWAEWFEAGSYDDSGNYDDGELGPEDIVMHKIRKILLADSLIQNVFGLDGVEVWEIAPPVDIQMLPKIQIYLNSTDEKMAPTAVDDDEFRVFISIRYDPGPGLQEIPANKPSVATMVKHIKVLLKASGSKKLMENLNGVEAQLSVNSYPGLVPWRHTVVTGADNRLVAIVEFDWVYEVHLEHSTGRIINIQENVT